MKNQTAFIVRTILLFGYLLLMMDGLMNNNTTHQTLFNLRNRIYDTNNKSLQKVRIKIYNNFLSKQQPHVVQNWGYITE